MLWEFPSRLASKIIPILEELQKSCIPAPAVYVYLPLTGMSGSESHGMIVVITGAGEYTFS